MTLKDEMGLWLSGEALTTHILASFKKLFMGTLVHMCLDARLGQQYSPNSPFLEHSQWLSSIPQSKEISWSIFSLPPLKAPGPNGYHAIFFQKN